MLFLGFQIWRVTQLVSLPMQRVAQRPKTGQGLVEYALVIALIAVVAVATLTLLGGNLKSTFSNIMSSLNLPNTGE